MSFSKRGLYALGRLPVGQLNKTEAMYSAHLNSRLIEGELAWFKFEAMKLRLADNTFFSPDFAVMRADGTLEMHEVKGARAVFQDDARVKVKVAAATFPFAFLVAYPIPAKKGGGWELEAF